MTVDKFGRSREIKVQETTSAFDTTNMRGNLYMNGFRISGLPTGLKTSSSDAVSWGQADLLIRHGIRGHVENYLESFALKNYAGYIPPLSANNGKQGFFVSASSELRERYSASKAFNTNGEWVSNVNSNFYIQIRLPESLRIWRIALRGRKETRAGRIFNWRIDGSTDGTEFTMLFRAPNPTYLGDDLQYFLIETTNKYNYYRLTCLEAEEGNPGLSYFQLFTYSD